MAASIRARCSGVNFASSSSGIGSWPVPCGLSVTSHVPGLAFAWRGSAGCASPDLMHRSIDDRKLDRARASGGVPDPLGRLREVSGLREHDVGYIFLRVAVVEGKPG